MVEVDGDRWHAHRTARRRGHLRDAEVQARGYLVLRVLADDLECRPREVAQRLAGLLAVRAA